MTTSPHFPLGSVWITAAKRRACVVGVRAHTDTVEFHYLGENGLPLRERAGYKLKGEHRFVADQGFALRYFERVS